MKNLFERVGNLIEDQPKKKTIDFSMQVDLESLEITADKALIEQVLINI